jgi:membrane-associated phospholipid phosphatase
MDAWVVISVMGDPRIWGVIGSLIAAFYVLLRVFCPDDWLEGDRHWIKVFSLVFSLSLLTTLFAVYAIKTTVGIERPCTPCTSPEMSACNPYCDFDGWDSSFPSGHAATAFVGPALIYLMFRRRWLLSLFGISFFVALSRIAMGVHTPTDVAVGAAMGFAITGAFWRIRARIPVFGIN